MPEMLPLMFRGDQLRVLVVGGGEIALRKVEALLDVGAVVTVISPRVTPELARLIDDSERAQLIQREFNPDDLHSEPEAPQVPFTLVVGATDNASVNQQVSVQACRLGLPVNIVDVPELCSVYFAATVRDEPLLLAISSSGQAPFLVKQLKPEAAELASRWAPRARWAARFRVWVREQVPAPEQRAALYERFLDLDDADVTRWDFTQPPFDLWRRWKAEEDA